MIGVLAEDETDCLAAEVLVKRITNDVGRARFHVPKAWGKGCARLRAKAPARLKDMAKRGCVAAIVIHDLDRNPQTNALNDPEVLHRELEAIECPPELRRLICIPVEEIEAWFWSDDVTVKLVGRGTGSAHLSPHNIIDPKGKLEDLSIGANRKPRYTTNDNPMLAEHLTMDICAQRCASFRAFRDFVRQVLAA